MQNVSEPGMAARAGGGERILQRIRGEFLEMPGLRLTEAQARRLWALDAATCSAMLAELVESGFLYRTRDGAFMRLEHAGPGAAAPRRPLRHTAA
jgi:hypothetical protein